MNWRSLPRPAGRGAHPAGVILAAVACLFPALALAQSSATRSLRPGYQTSGGGTSVSASFQVVGELGSSAGMSRSSGSGADVFPAFIGSAFSQRDTIFVATTANTYRAVSIPLRTSNSAVTSVFASLGGVNNTNWRLGHFSPVDNAYQEPGTALNLANVAQADGYWLITASNQSVQVPGLTAPNLPFRASLLGGANAWNQIGNPFTFPVAVGKILVTDGIITKAVDDVTNTLTEQVIKSGNGPPYVNASVLNGRTGYFIRKVVAGAVTIIYPNAASLTGIPVPQTVQRPEASLWALGITGRQNGRETEPLMVGAAPVRAGEANVLHQALAPAPPDAEVLQLSIARRDLGQLSGPYVRDFGPPAEQMAWEIQVMGAESPGDVTLDFTGFELPVGLKIYLTDTIAGWTREVEPGASLTVATSAGVRTFRLDVVGGNQRLVTSPLVDALRIAYPNPFRGETGLNFSLARGGDAVVEVFDVQGRKVQSLARRGLPAGEHVLVWDGRDSGGRRLGSGIYLARWQAGTARGRVRLVRIE